MKAGLASVWRDHPDGPGPAPLLAEGLGRAALSLLPATLGGTAFVRHRLYPKQAAIIDDPARFTITEATTKAGKTMSHIEWILEEAHALGRGNLWWVATISGTADIAFRRTQERLRGLLDSGGGMVRVGEPIPFVKNLTEKWIEVFGARIWFKSADKPDTLYGEDVYRLVGDEITRWKVDSWTACYSTLTATRGRAKLIGNVKGRRNFAYQLARKAEAKEQDWGYHKLTAEDAIAGGVIEADIVEQARRDLPEAVFNELYMADPSDDGGNPFGIDAIRAVKVAAPSTLPPVAYGLDLAKSQDWTVLYGLDAEGRECVFQRWQGPWRQTIQRVKAAVGRVPCLVDSTGVGDPVLEELQAGGGQNFTGYKFTSPSKQQLMEGLAVAIQKQEIRVASAVTIAELEAFEYEYTRTGVRYSAPAGVHDDCVMALALARQCAAEMGRAPVPFAFAG